MCVGGVGVISAYLISWFVVTQSVCGGGEGGEEGDQCLSDLFW